MKKGDKIFLCTIATFLVIGLALVTGGCMLGGITQAKEMINSNNTKWQNPFYVEKNFSTKGTKLSAGEKQSINPESISGVNFNLSSGTISVATGNSNTIDIELDGSSSVRYYEEDGTLFINSADGYGNCDATIVLPKDICLESAIFSVGAAELDIDNINCKMLSVDVGAGEADINNVDATENAILSIGAGEMTIKESNLNNANVDLGMGEFNFVGIIPGNLVLECGMGSASLKLEDVKENHSIISECGMGSIDIDGSSKVSFGEGVTTGSNNNSVYNISCGMGSVDIDFLK